MDQFGCGICCSRSSLDGIDALLSRCFKPVVVTRSDFYYGVSPLAVHAEEQYRQAVVLQQEQLEQSQELGKALHTSQMNAKELQAVYDALKAKLPMPLLP